MSDRVRIDRRLYLTEDRTRVVAEGDPTGRWLWAAPGDEVPRTDAERLGAIAPPPPQPASAPEPGPAEPKQRPAPPNKQRTRARNKST